MKTIFIKMILQITMLTFCVNSFASDESSFIEADQSVVDSAIQALAKANPRIRTYEDGYNPTLAEFVMRNSLSSQYTNDKGQKTAVLVVNTAKCRKKNLEDKNYTCYYFITSYSDVTLTPSGDFLIPEEYDTEGIFTVIIEFLYDGKNNVSNVELSYAD